MQTMATNLIASLRHPTLKLAAAMRTISWLRRVAPELDPAPISMVQNGGGGTLNASREGSLGSLFLVCRLANLQQMLAALEPLRELADQETLRLRDRQSGAGAKVGKWEAGQQTEKYLKRYVEIFREQSFAIISMYRSIFPASTAVERVDSGGWDADPLQPLPSALATFPLKLVGMLEDTLRRYLPNVRDKSSKDTLLTQVLYCAGSLGRLGGDFSLILAFLHENSQAMEEEDEEDWVDVIKKHRVLAGRLELMVGAGKEG